MTTYNNQDELRRQWMEALGPGWPCEVWGSPEKEFISLYYFSHLENNSGDIRGDYRFKDCYSEIYVGQYFRPLSTPLDFVPEWATHIEFDREGYFYFSEINNMGYSTLRNEKLLWPNCPKGLKDNILAIPDDWRPK